MAAGIEMRLRAPSFSSVFPGLLPRSFALTVLSAGLHGPCSLRSDERPGFLCALSRSLPSPTRPFCHVPGSLGRAAARGGRGGKLTRRPWLHAMARSSHGCSAAELGKPDHRTSRPTPRQFQLEHWTGTWAPCRRPCAWAQCSKKIETLSPFLRWRAHGCFDERWVAVTGAGYRPGFGRPVLVQRGYRRV